MNMDKNWHRGVIIYLQKRAYFERVGNGAPFRDKPPVVSKGCVESGKFN